MYRKLLEDKTTASNDDESVIRHTQIIELSSLSPFRSELITVESGQYQGCQALVFETLKSLKSTFPLLALPPEIRNAIYKYALIDSKAKDGIIQVNINSLLKITFREFGKTNRDHIAAVLKVNRQVRDEALPIFYSQARFEFRNNRAFLGFLSGHPNARRYLKDVYISWMSRSKIYHIGQELLQCSRLQKLVIESWISEKQLESDVKHVYECTLKKCTSEEIGREVVWDFLQKTLFQSSSRGRFVNATQHRIREMLLACWEKDASRRSRRGSCKT
ncbi:MAG: hypothetical protein M1821_003292 [Bathelium mastoideum]|nr:MAG: hypothetical protein M1821_003292 [Bathelium mastoideum]